jgi:hypothetical protein
MGLLDNLLMSANTDFGGQQGGLLDMLKNIQMQQSQDQPSAGFIAQNDQPSPLDSAQYPAGPVGAPMNANAQAPQGYPGQTGNIAVGNYQMPQIGGPAQSDALPQNAQAAQGQLPTQ